MNFVLFCRKWNHLQKGESNCFDEMAESSRTDVSAFRRAAFVEKTSRRCSQSRFEQSKDSNWLDRIHSNVIKHSKGSHANAMERSQKSHTNASKPSQESHFNIRKNTHERSRLNAEDNSKLRRLNNAIDSNKTSNKEQGSHLSAKKDSQETHSSTSGEHSDESESIALKQPRKPAFRKKMPSEGVKRLKHSPTKKDTSWKQNSRSRRLVANARERSRIHILSDAFENLRRAVPSYSQDQKLSKLAILKLATYYISALTNLAESDTSARSLKQFADCVAHCTKALQTEGRSRRKHF